MINRINSFSPDVLLIGMTAPKQEKWAVKHFDILDARHICSIGAAFEFYAKTKRRSPQWLITIWLEWFHRLVKEPVRLWRRYIIGIFKFLFLLVREKFRKDKNL
jgi:N-acetylglucosaminyldiphosphoundecaprenol N-acetyl-beta-D-mannosaminyltransferase